MIRLAIAAIGPGASVQDLGRTGFRRIGVCEGGAMDRLALAEAGALLGQSPGFAAIELASGGAFSVQGGAARIALTGARALARLDGAPLRWRSSFAIEPGQRLELGAPRDGVYAYLSVGGGIDVPRALGSRSTHLRAGFGGFEGRALEAGDALPIGADPGGLVDRALPEREEKDDAPLRVMLGPQAGAFEPEALERLEGQAFRFSARRDRMGVALEAASPLRAPGGARLLSDAVLAGDLQVTGDGAATLLLADRQPTGGYPRIALVIGADLDRAAQTPSGAERRFERIGAEEARAAWATRAAVIAGLPERLEPVRIDPRERPERLTERNLISGVIDARAQEEGAR